MSEITSSFKLLNAVGTVRLGWLLKLHSMKFASCDSHEPMKVNSGMLNFLCWLPCLKVWSLACSAVWEAVEPSGDGVPLDEMDSWRVSLEVYAMVLLPVHFLLPVSQPNSFCLLSIPSIFLCRWILRTLTHKHLSCKPLSLGWLP